MTTLTYRGKEYLQQKTDEATPKHLIELTYRRNVYTKRKADALAQHPLLNYRGVEYQK